MSKRKSRPSSLQKSEAVKGTQTVPMDVFTDPDAQVSESGTDGLAGVDIDNFLSSLPGGDGYGNHAGTDKITRRDDGTLIYRGWSITATGLTAPVNATEADFTAIGYMLLQLETSMQWLLGDWLKEGENRKWGETYEQIAGQFGYQVKTLQDYASVCRNVEASIRIEVLSFGHHQIIAKYRSNSAVQRTLLKRAEQHGWSIKTFRQMLKDYQPIIDQAVHQGWSQTQFERALRSFEPDDGDSKKAEAPLQTRAMQSWGVLRSFGAKLEHGTQLSQKQRQETRHQIASLREYLEFLDHRLDEQESS